MKTLQRIGDALQEKNGLSDHHIEDVLEEARDTDRTLDEILVDEGVLPEEDVLSIISDCLDLPFEKDLTGLRTPEVFLENVPVKFARRNNIIAVDEREGKVILAVNHPLKFHPVDEVSEMMGQPVETIVSTREEIAAAINRAYKEQTDVVDEMLDDMEPDDVEEIADELDTSQDLLDLANKAPIIKLVNMILFQALEMRASDVHIQPYEDKLQVRYRVDGILYDMMTPPKRVQDAIISRVKVMGDMDIAERRLPQDGRTSIKVGDRDVDVRISCVPTTHGERIVMRLLDKSVRMYQLEELGMADDHLEMMKEMINTPHGILLDTGPTGSGKTTTLYASLQHLNTKEKNILTIEDPVEYQLPGISQIEIAPKKGLTFASGLRSIVRQDPDVIMVGEIRDLETATIAIQSALTGHLVFSTLHTNDSASAVTRLQDLGVESYLVASSIVGVLAQRLVRKICEHCKVKYEPEPEHLAKIDLTPEDLPPDGKLWKGAGCDNCMGTGYHDRTGIYEILPMDDTVRDQVMEKKSASVIKRGAMDRGLKTLRMDGADKVLDGKTTVEEVFRITQVDVG